MKNKAYIILAVLLLLPFMAAPVHAGVSKTVAKGGWEMVERGVKYIVKSATREASEEVSESAARKLVREAIQHSDDVAKIAKEFGEEGLVMIVKSPAARTLCQEAGEDATIAILKHGNLGVDLLSKTPKECLPGVARALSGMEKAATRRLSERIGVLGATSAVAAGEALKWVADHPKLAASGVIGAWLIAHPETRAMLVWVMGHPILSIFLALLLVVAFKLLWKYGAPMLINKLRRRMASN